MKNNLMNNNIIHMIGDFIFFLSLILQPVFLELTKTVKENVKK